MQRLTVRQAADALGISENAVRQRIKRKSLAAQREEGRVWVSVATDQSDQGADQGADQSAASLEALYERLLASQDALLKERARRIEDLTALAEGQAHLLDERDRQLEASRQRVEQLERSLTAFWRQLEARAPALLRRPGE